MNRTERAMKRKAREWQDEVRRNRNYYLNGVKDIEFGDFNAESFHMEQARVSKMKKYVKTTLVKKKVAMINSRKEKIGA